MFLLVMLKLVEISKPRDDPVLWAAWYIILMNKEIWAEQVDMENLPFLPVFLF